MITTGLGAIIYWKFSMPYTIFSSNIGHTNPEWDSVQQVRLHTLPYDGIAYV